MEGRGYSGGTGDWFVYFLKWALMGRVKAFVEWVEAHPSADGELALAGIRQVYDFHWPHNASCGYIFHGLWGWLQLELEKPGEKAPPSIAEQMEYITRHLEAQGMRVKAWTSLGPGGVMGIPEPMEKASPFSKRAPTAYPTVPMSIKVLISNKIVPTNWPKRAHLKAQMQKLMQKSS